jgi:hypothetical protein
MTSQACLCTTAVAAVAAVVQTLLAMKVVVTAALAVAVAADCTETTLERGPPALVDLMAVKMVYCLLEPVVLVVLTLAVAVVAVVVMPAQHLAAAQAVLVL